MTTKAGIGVMHLKAKDFWQTPEARKRQGRILDFRGSMAPAKTLISNYENKFLLF